MENLSIRCWAEDDRPREKMALKGRSALSNAELLAILIGSGTKKKSAVDLAQEILSSFNNNLHQLSKKSIEDFCKFSGIGEAKAITIMAAMELARRRDQEPPESLVHVKSSNGAYQVLKPRLTDLYHEEFHTIFLSRSNRVLCTELISKGGFSSTVVDSKIIFKKALDVKASSIILAHNHPSGNLKPSEQDEALTKRIVAAGKLLEIQVLDHIIVGDLGFLSFADEGLM